MGSAQSYLSSETAITAVAIAGAIGFGYAQVAKSSQVPPSNEDTNARKGKRKKLPKGLAGDTGDRDTKHLGGSGVAQTVKAEVIPGQFEPDSIPATPDAEPIATAEAKAKKSKKKRKTPTASDTQSLESFVDQVVPGVKNGSKAKTAKRASQPSRTYHTPFGAEATATSSSRPSQPLHLSAASIDTDDSWTQVGPRRVASSAQSAGPSDPLSADATTSDTALSSSQAGNLSTAERTDDDVPNSFLLQQSSEEPSTHRREQNRKTLAEKILPKPRKTGVEDMLESPDYPSLSRVMRVTPLPSEKPAAGFSWGDYEDVRVTTDGGENDADGEDDGWGVVTGKRPKRNDLPSASASQSISSIPKTSEATTKRQRQNAQKREMQKAAKADAETQRLAALAKHKRDLETARIAEQSRRSGVNAASGGMKATIDDKGKLVWE